MRIVGQEAIAEAFGVAPKTIVEWQEQGFPIAERGRRGVASEYDLPECITWLVERERKKVQVETPRDRMYRLQGDKVALEMAESLKALVPAGAIEQKWNAAVVAAREQLVRERRRLAAELGKAQSGAEREKILAAAHDSFLRTLASWRGADKASEQAAA